MSSERVIALEIALKAVLNTAREQGVDVERLSKEAVRGLVTQGPDDVHQIDAAYEVEIAVDDLEYPWPALG
jgi:hypothetical protein